MSLFCTPKKAVIYPCLMSLFLLLSFPSYGYFSKGTYVGFHIGEGDLDYSASDLGFTPARKKSSNNDKVTWRADAGYQINQNFALEFGYMEWEPKKFTNVAGVSGAKGEVEQKSADLMAKFVFPLSSTTHVYAKGGVTYAKAETNLNSVTKASTMLVGDDSSAFRSIFGLGAGVEVYPNVTADVVWMRIPSGNGIKNSDFLGIGITYMMGYLG